MTFPAPKRQAPLRSLRSAADLTGHGLAGPEKRAAIEKVRAQLGNEYPLVIGGERIKTGSMLESINPAKRTQVVGNRVREGFQLPVGGRELPVHCTQRELSVDPGHHLLHLQRLDHVVHRPHGKSRELVLGIRE